jgi:dienelactone hydrolase
MWNFRRGIILALILCFSGGAEASSKRQTIQSSGRSVTYEIFENSTPNVPLLVFLHGSSGPDSEFYRAQAQFFAGNGYEVLLLHYFDASPSRQPTDQNYHVWAQALEDLVRACGISPSFIGRPIFVVGDSLGASVALAAGSQGLPVRAIAEWYGSLPDKFFYNFKTMPPLLILHGALDDNIPVSSAQQLVQLCAMKQLICADHIYPDQQHGFSGNALGDAEQRTLRFFKEH